MNTRSSLSLLFCWIALPSAASGALIVFDNEADFLTATEIVSTETFDAIPSGTNLGNPAVTLSGVTYSAINPAPPGPTPPELIGWFVFGSTVAASPPNVFAYSQFREVTQMSFGEGLAVKAIGFSLTTGGGPSNAYQLTLNFGNGTEAVVNAAGSKFYRGFLADEKIQSIAVDTRSATSSFNFELDNVSRSAIEPAIPEPASWLLAALAAAGSLCVSKRRTNEVQGHACSLPTTQRKGDLPHTGDFRRGPPDYSQPSTIGHRGTE
jgi:hypothetical protein